ncbi:hypothetical protein V491_07104 [Pseudogymnoascus sp. VKM F-3775]|nr:hypothetical protein V491_07104 [Pseudogymnoascus sp. VKM F-3775]
MSEVASTTSVLADSFQRCSRSFKDLYVTLFAYGSISLSRFNDEYGRFGVWGGDSGADRMGRGSLDDVLRNDSKTASIIAELLENLNYDLNICISLVKASADQDQMKSHDEQAWLSDEESSVSSQSDTSDFKAGSRVPSKTQRILRLLAIIVDHIQSLFQVSALLRRPTISNKYLRSVSKKTATEMESPFYNLDLAHIIEKRRFWINQQKWGVPVGKNEVEGNCLIQRLATANVKRREQLHYWQAHPAQRSVVKLPCEPIDLDTIITTPNPNPTQQLPEKAGPESEISKPSHSTKRSFSTIVKSDLNDSATFSGRPQTEYVPSTKSGEYILGVPPVLEVIDESPTFKCPYCSTTLDAKAMLQRDLWKKHVFRDLRPYLCTFEQCENPEKLYLTRHDWIYHETQMHRRQWICASCSQQKFSSRSDMKIHFMEKHAGQFPESQIMTMVDISERPMDDDEGADCPICLATLSLSALRIHLATHLEELALFVLPCHMEDRSQHVGSDKAEGTTGRRLASNASGSDDGLPSLDFEKSSLDTSFSQDPELFSTLLQSTIDSGDKDIEAWVLTNGLAEQRDDGVKGNQVGLKNIKPAAFSASQAEDVPYTGVLREFQIAKSKDFKEGRVFKALWIEPEGNNSGNSGHYKRGPILNYGKHGTAKPGIHSAHHSIIFTESQSANPPRSIEHPPTEIEGEQPLPNEPVCVELRNQRDQLDITSRLNYAKMYTVEHNIKVCFIGSIHEASRKQFKKSFHRIENDDSLSPTMEEGEEEEGGVHSDNRRFEY